jgi:thioredoxin-like negative regulator of GroEL
VPGSITNFAAEVLQHDRPVLVAFRSAWCLRSQQLVPVVDDMAAYDGRIKVVGVKVEGDVAANMVCRLWNVTPCRS